MFHSTPTLARALLLVAAAAACCGPPTSEAVPAPTQGTTRAAVCRIDEPGRHHIDAWLERQGLNQYGDPIGSAYPGATPLFIEATGKVWDRYEYVLTRHPELTDGLCEGLRLLDRFWIELQRTGAGLDPIGRPIQKGAPSPFEPSPLVTESGALVDRAAYLVLEHAYWHVPVLQRQAEQRQRSLRELLDAPYPMKVADDTGRAGEDR